MILGLSPATAATSSSTVLTVMALPPLPPVVGPSGLSSAYPSRPEAWLGFQESIQSCQVGAAKTAVLKLKAATRTLDLILTDCNRSSLLHLPTRPSSSYIPHRQAISDPDVHHSAYHNPVHYCSANLSHRQALPQLVRRCNAMLHRSKRLRDELQISPLRKAAKQYIRLGCSCRWCGVHEGNVRKRYAGRWKGFLDHWTTLWGNFTCNDAVLKGYIVGRLLG